MNLPPFDEKRYLGNLLLDEYRAAYARLDSDQKRLIRLAFYAGWAEAKQEDKDK
jgi:hypothetical protein